MCCVCCNMAFNLSGTIVRPTDNVKYLGIWLDRRSYRKHVIETSVKADKMGNNLIRLMSNTRGPMMSNRRLLAWVVDSILLYAAPVWRGALELASTRGIIEKCRRKVAIRITTAYRTVSLDAVLVLSGMPPIELLAEVRTKTYCGRKKKRLQQKYMSCGRPGGKCLSKEGGPLPLYEA